MNSLTELRAMLKKKKRGYLHYNKSELIDVLIKRGLLPDTLQLSLHHVSETNSRKK